MRVANNRTRPIIDYPLIINERFLHKFLRKSELGKNYRIQDIEDFFKITIFKKGKYYVWIEKICMDLIPVSYCGNWNKYDIKKIIRIHKLLQYVL